MKTTHLLAVASLVATLGFSSDAASAQVTVVGNSIHEQEAEAGSEYLASIALRNEGAKIVEVRLYLTDYSFSANGTSDFKEAGTTARSNARWISLSAQTVSIAPQQTLSVPYRVHVPSPSIPLLSGSYWSTAMVEVVPLMNAATAKSSGLQVNTVVRQAVQVVTHVGTLAQASIQFSNLRSYQTADAGRLQFDTENTGARARRLSLSLDLYREDGTLVGRYSHARGLVLPGCSIRESFDIGRLKPGNYLAFIVADAGRDDLFAGRFKVTL